MISFDVLFFLLMQAVTVSDPAAWRTTASVTRPRLPAQTCASVSAARISTRGHFYTYTAISFIFRAGHHWLIVITRKICMDSWILTFRLRGSDVDNIYSRFILSCFLVVPYSDEIRSSINIGKFWIWIFFYLIWVMFRTGRKRFLNFNFSVL